MHKSCVDVPQFYANRQGPNTETEKEIIVATGDGKGVVMRKDQLEKKVVKKRLTPISHTFQENLNDLSRHLS